MNRNNWVHGKLTGFHNHSEVLNFRDVELTLLEFEMEVKLSHSLEDAVSSFSMGFRVGGSDEEVIHVDD